MIRKVLSVGSIATALLAVNAAYAAPPVSQLNIPWEGVIDLGTASTFDVYYRVFADPNNSLCSNGPLTCEFEGSPIIAKKDGDGTTTGDAYTGQIFTGANIGDTATPSGGGTWSYSLGSGPDQHYVTAWAVKDGSPDLLTIFWLVADGTVVTGDTGYAGIQASTGVNYPWWAVNTCTDGKTDQPEGDDLCKAGGLSNIVWYNSGGNNPPEEIPEPGLLGLLGLVFAGVGFAARRRRG